MKKDEIKKELLAFIKSKNLDASKFNEDSNLKTLGFDSLDLLDFVVEVEDKFNIQISDDELTKTKNFGDLVTLIEKNKN